MATTRTRVAQHRVEQLRPYMAELKDDATLQQRIGEIKRRAFEGDLTDEEADAQVESELGLALDRIVARTWSRP